MEMGKREKRNFGSIEEVVVDESGKIVSSAFQPENAQANQQPVIIREEISQEKIDEIIETVTRKVFERVARLLMAKASAKSTAQEVKDAVREELSQPIRERIVYVETVNGAVQPVEQVKEVPVKVVQVPVKAEEVEEVEEIEEIPEVIEEIPEDIEEIPEDIEEIPAETEEAITEEVEVAPEMEAVLDQAEKKKVVVKTFAQKMVEADEVLQDRYDELKNYALRFKKLKSRISRKFDSINKGRLQFVKLSVAGKTLKLYLNMDINSVDSKFHCKDMIDKKTYVTVPVLLRIKSGRAVKYAKILIDQCAEFHGLAENKKFEEVDAMALIEQSLSDKDMDVEVLDSNIAVTEDGGDE